MTTKLPSYFMVSESDGGLYDTRKPDWSKQAVRPNYSRHHKTIQTAIDCKATLRAGGYAWPGGHPLFLITHDSAALCFSCARKNWRNIASDFLWKTSSGWMVAGCDVNYEDSDLTCDHCSKHIPSAYGE